MKTALKKMILMSHQEQTEETDEITKYLTITPLDNNFKISFSGSYTPKYSYDGETWIDWSQNVTLLISNAGSKLYVKGNLTPGSKCGTFTTENRFNLSGNCNSMIFGDDAELDYTTNITNYSNAFEGLFKNCSVVNVSKNFLPSTTISNYSYRYMFQNCTLLETPPDLPALYIGSYSYSDMFSGCSNLKYTPSLPAKTIGSYSYQNMFKGCSLIVSMPDLPCTDLKNHCYRYMFQDCLNLVELKELPAITLQPYCYYGMFSGCKSIKKMSIIKATTLANSCCIQMFQYCTSLTEAELPATTLAAYCYQQMFADCTSLTNITALPATTLTNYCYMGMFINCTSLVTAPELPATTLTNYCYYMMFYGCTSLNYIKALFNTTPQTTYMNNWVNGVSSTGTFVKSKDATWNPEYNRGTSGIPSNWTVETI